MVTNDDIIKAKYVAKLSISLISFGTIFVLGLFFYAAHYISELKTEISNLNVTRKDLQNKLDELQNEIKQKNIDKEDIDKKINNLNNTQKSIFDFLTSITNANKIKFIDSDIDWEKVQEHLIYMKSGKRKEAIFGAIIMSSVGIRFKLGEKSPQKGFDSSTFIEYVLSQVGVKINRQANKRPSESIMGQFIKVSDPQPGDLLFFKGEIGNFGLFYLAPGSSSGHGIAIGALGSENPCVIADTQSINPDFPFIGYFRVIYPDER
jgi:cell wall-associated NlpC family hydrolase